MGTITGKKELISVNLDCLIAYLIALSLLLIKLLSLPKKVLTKAAMDLLGKAKKDARSAEAENNKPAEPETEIKNKQVGKTSDGCICNDQ